MASLLSIDYGDTPRDKKRKLDQDEPERRQSTRAVYARKRAVTACQTCRGRKKKW